MLQYFVALRLMQMPLPTMVSAFLLERGLEKKFSFHQKLTDTNVFFIFIFIFTFAKGYSHLRLIYHIKSLIQNKALK